MEREIDAYEKSGVGEESSSSKLDQPLEFSSSNSDVPSVSDRRRKIEGMRKFIASLNLQSMTEEEHKSLIDDSIEHDIDEGVLDVKHYPEYNRKRSEAVVSIDTSSHTKKQRRSTGNAYFYG